jgi:hypothetical protein
VTSWGEVGGIVPCIVCGKTLRPVTSDRPNHAYDANEFFSPGQFGSTAFDPVNGDGLAVNICDACLIEAQRLGRVLLAKEGARARYVWKR